MNLLKFESYKKGIVLSTAFNVLAKLLFFATTVAIAAYFGTQAKTDVYFYSLATMTLLANFFNSLNAAVLIPESMRLAEQESPEVSFAFLNFFVYLYLFLGILISALLSINPPRAFQVLSSFKPEVLNVNSMILFFSALLLTLMILSTLLNDILTSQKFFTIPMISSSLNSVISLLFLVLFHRKLDILSMVIGLLAGYLLQIALLTCLMRHSLGWRFRPRRIFPERRIWRNILFAQAGTLTSTLGSYVPLFMLSGFGAGVITALNYGQRISETPNTFIASQFSVVTGIKLNELFAKKQWDQINDIAFSSFHTLLFILTPMSFFLSLYSHEIVAVLFKRGAFTENSVVTTASFLGYFALLLPLYPINILVSRLNMASQRVRETFWYQIVLNMVLIPCVVVGVRRFGALGYVWALLTLHVINNFMCFFLLRWFFPFVQKRRIFTGAARILSLNLVLVSGIYGLKCLMPGLPAVVKLALGLIVYVAVVLLLNSILKISPELHELTRTFRARALSWHGKVVETGRDPSEDKNSKMMGNAHSTGYKA